MKAQDAHLRNVTDRLVALESRFAEVAINVNKELHPSFFTIMASRWWILSHGLRLFLANCLHSPEYFGSLKTLLSRSYLYGAQDGLIAGIEHGRSGIELSDLDGYRPSAKTDYDSAYAVFRSLEFPLLSSLESHKDSSIGSIMTLLCLDDQLSKELDMVGLQPSVRQLTIPLRGAFSGIVASETALSSALGFVHERAEKVKSLVSSG